jgi:superfamily II DNA or RNA helicase
LVTIDYLDSDGVRQERLLWEAEPFAQSVEPGELPGVGSGSPMDPGNFRSLVRALRWTSLEPFLGLDGRSAPFTAPLSASPLHGAIQAEDYQLVPLWQAMRMPRVTLLLADDVGLGKTIEAGLVLSELLRRRRVRRVLVLCPASLRQQWVQELSDKFCLHFDIVDRQSTTRLRRDAGLDANPWRSFARAVTSYDYLKQPDVLESFLAASGRDEDLGGRAAGSGSPHLPWDLLIVDEAHNLAPPPLGEPSAAAELLRILSPLFEHRLFLTATPHNGHTASFTGLLEALDPVAFTRRHDALREPERRRLAQVQIRRLKRQINEADRSAGRPTRFSDRQLHDLELRFGPREVALQEAAREFRDQIQRRTASSSGGERRTGRFAVEILIKRLLSGPVTFAASWWRLRDGARETELTASPREIEASVEALDDLADDREAEQRRGLAARQIGAWLRPHLQDPELAATARSIDLALESLGLPAETFDLNAARPTEDARFARLLELIDAHLRQGKTWRNDERLVVFTEYKTTLDTLLARLLRHYGEDAGSGRLRVLYGGLEAGDRARVLAAFNDPGDPVRLLLATDTASEGLNLQRTARLLLHFDVPWNPSRLEQRNGRLDRHGQARDVLAFHFSSQAEDEVRFLARVIEKVEQQREDLGSVGEVFDRALERRLIDGLGDADTLPELDRQSDQLRSRTEDVRAAARSAAEAIGPAADRAQELAALTRAIDLSPAALRQLLETVLGKSALEGPDAQGGFRLLPGRIPPAWQQLQDEHLRRGGEPGKKGALARLLFDAQHCLEPVRTPTGEATGRAVFRPAADALLMHLGHPLIERALAHLVEQRFPTPGKRLGASRFTVSLAADPLPTALPRADAWLLVTVEELAVNRLRETFHRWVRTRVFPLRHTPGGFELGGPVPLPEPAAVEQALLPAAPADIERARALWLDVEDALEAELDQLRTELNQSLTDALATQLERMRQQTLEQHRSRQGELSTLIESQTERALEREIDELRQRANQGQLFSEIGELERLGREVAAREAELARRRQHYASLRQALDQERERLLNRVLPARFALEGQALQFPVAVEIVLKAPAR